MPIGRALLAGAVAGILSIFTSWLITGVLFHRFQRLTPATWRPEGPQQYALASALNVLASVLLALFLTATGGVGPISGATWPANGALFGAMCWTVAAAPVLLSVAIFVNVNRGVVIGLLLDWLVVAVLAGVITAWALQL